MTPEEFNKAVDDLVERLLDLSSEDQQAALDRLRPQQPKVCAEAAAVIAGRNTGSFQRLFPSHPIRLDPLSPAPLIDAGQEPLPTIDGYEILNEVGRGGMGVVYKARHIRLNRIVALKLVLPRPHNDQKGYATSFDINRRFRKEARIASQLQHPGIPPIYELGELPNKRPYLSMKFIEGKALSEMLRSRGSPSHDLPSFLAIFQQMCQTLAFAHSRGVLHRDLKPENVMVGAFGEVQVMDWGLSKELSESGEAEQMNASQYPELSAFRMHQRELAENPDEDLYTKAGSVLGTPAYMSPEQAHSQAVDKRSDVFGLGAILCEILTGGPPYSGSWPESLDKARNTATAAAFTKLDKMESSGLVDNQLVKLVKECLAKGPDERPDDAAVVAEEMAKYLNGVEQKLQQKVRDAEVERARAEVKADTEAKSRAALEEQLYANRIAVAERELTLDQDVGLASDLLSQCPERLRGWEWNYLMHLRDGDCEPLTGHEGGLWRAVFSPDGRRIATASIDGTAKVWDAATGRLLLTFNGHAIKFPLLLRPFLPSPPRVPVMCAAFSPDGRFVATGSLAPNLGSLKDLKELRNPRKAKGVVHIWDAETGSIAATFDKRTGIVDTLAFSPDGTRIASSNISEEHGIVVWDARTGQEIKLLRGHLSHVHRLRFSFDGRMIASGCTDGTVKLWDATELQEVRSIKAHTAPIYDLAFSPDCKRVATASSDGTVAIWETMSGKPALQLLRGHTGAAMGVAFSPDGKRIATAGWDKSVRLWDAATGVEKITLRRHTGLVSSVAFSPNGSQLISAGFDNQVRIWDASAVQEKTGPGLFTLGEETDRIDHRVNAVAFSRDGRFLASAGWDMTARLWDGHTGELLKVFSGHEGAIWGVGFNSDGSQLVTASWDRTAKVWDTQSGDCLITFTGHATPLMGLGVSLDGRKIASCSFDGLVKIWDPATGRETSTCAGNLFPMVAAAFSPDGTRLASGSGDRSVKIWAAEDGRELRTLTGHKGLVHSVAYSPDGRCLASASWDHTVKVWSARSGRELLTLKGHRDRVQSVAFSPDGTLVASASEDKTVRVWDVVTGRQRSPARRHRGLVCSVGFSPDGKRLVAGVWSPACWVKTWPLDS